MQVARIAEETLFCMQKAAFDKTFDVIEVVCIQNVWVFNAFKRTPENRMDLTRQTWSLCQLASEQFESLDYI